MTTYIAMLRGINVSGQKKIAMQDLRTWLSSSGLDQVRSYIQSGNLVFQSNSSRSQLEKHIHKVLRDRTGWDIPVWVRTASDLRAVIDNNPYPNHFTEDHKIFLVTFLREAPSKVPDWDMERFLPDSFILQGDIIYVHAPGAYSKSKLNNNFLERSLKTPATTRNWRTVQKLLDMASEDS